LKKARRKGFSGGIQAGVSLSSEKVVERKGAGCSWNRRRCGGRRIVRSRCRGTAAVSRSLGQAGLQSIGDGKRIGPGREFRGSTAV
jgi:hypothetical protein